ncbi:hypothetical protein WJX82_001834 [Trebouxia sp. C0006]
MLCNNSTLPRVLPGRGGLKPEELENEFDAGLLQCPNFERSSACFQRRAGSTLTTLRHVPHAMAIRITFVHDSWGKPS